jgi:hypothetical protein
MYFSIISVILGSGLTLVQTLGLYLIFDVDKYISLRVVLNAMNNAAPFLCFGIDNAAPVIKRTNPGFPFFWNIIILHILISVVLIGVAVFADLGPKVLPILLGVAASTSVASTLIIANYYRAEGCHFKYFLGVNVIDKVFRTIVILILSFFVKKILWWSILLSVAGFGYAIFAAIRTGSGIQFDLRTLLCHLRVGMPFMFATVSIISITRFPFYVAYLFEDSAYVAKIDIWILFSLLFLIPSLNKSKIDESASRGLPKEYIIEAKKSWPIIRKYERFVLAGIVVIAMCAALVGHSEKKVITNIVMPLVIGMIMISSVPNYVQLLCFYKNTMMSVRVTSYVILATALCYLPQTFTNRFSTSFLFVASTFAYCAIGCVVARQMDIRIQDFWRWRHAVESVFICIIVSVVAYLI